LDCQAAEERLGFDVAARTRDLALEDLGNREVLHQRDDIRERLVQRQNVGIRGFVESAVHPVEHRMSGLVRDDVVREAGIDAGAWDELGWGVRARLEIPEQKSHLLWAVVGVRLMQAMRADAQAADEVAVVMRTSRDGPRAPEDRSAECPLEVPDRLHGD